MTTTTRSKTASIGGAAVIVAAIFMVAAITGADAQSPTAAPAPAPALDCMTALYNLSDCLSFVVAGNNLTKPDTGCCGELAGLVESNPICLCQLLGDPGATGVDIDLNKALKLPNVCGVSTPSVSLCSAFGVPVAVPTASVAVPTASKGPAPSSGSGSAPGSTPGSDNNGNGVSSSAVFDITIFMGLGIAFITLFL